MAELMAKSACEGRLPVTHGAVTLTEVDLGCLTSIAPYRGNEAAVSDVLAAAHGMAFPAPNRVTGTARARCIWTGRAQAFLAGPPPNENLVKHAATTDQSDAWATVELSGSGAEDVLARLCSVDFRAAVFKRGHTARTLCQHMTVSVSRLGEDRFLILCFRSMAATLVHELESAMASVAARNTAE